MNILGIRLESHEYCQEFTTVYKIWLRILHKHLLGISYEYVEFICESGMIKIHFVTILDIHGNLPQDRYEKALTSAASYMFNIQ